MNNWNEIWNKEERVSDAILDVLIKSDGFDVGAGGFSLKGWKNYTRSVIDKFNLELDSSVFEIGCGSGAFLYPFFKRGDSVGGLDFSKVLIELANTFMREGEFVVAEAVHMDTNKKYDLVFSHSVFQYFPSHDYAKLVLEKMTEKSKNIISILDVNDIEKEQKYHLVRSQGLEAGEYENKYKGLEHLFYEKEWFFSFAKKHNLNIEIFDQNFKEYGNSELRFNVIMKKK